MAAYCALTDVEARLRGAALGASTTPTSTEATNVMADVYAEINAAIASHGITTPITTPAGFLAWLVAVNADGAASIVAAVRYADADGVNSDNGASLLRERFDAAMARLWDGSAIPSDLSVSSAALPSSYTVAYPDELPDVDVVGANVMGAFAEFEL